jgi:hypothetical protein
VVLGTEDWGPLRRGPMRIPGTRSQWAVGWENGIGPRERERNWPRSRVILSLFAFSFS